MNPIVRNILAVITGWLLGSVINMSLIKVGHAVFPMEGVDINDMKALAAVMPTLEFKYFIFPFLAHAVGTLAGALMAGVLSATHKMKFALGIGVLFLIGGILACFLIPAPAWFIVADLALAYIPMAWIGGTIATRISKSK